MSVIATKIYKDKIIIGCDTQNSVGGYKLMGDGRGDSKDYTKIIQQNGMTIGHVGTCRDMAFMQIFSRNHKPLSGSEDAILDFMVEFIDWCKMKDNSFYLSSDFFIIFEGKVFEIWHNLDISRIEDYYALGSGMFIAMGVLYVGKDVKTALEAACNLVEGCSLPIRIYEIPL